MQIGKVIRKYRKERNMTQEEMAYRLGVTAPAVNKWEKGNSYPDITLLAPIARLLNISVDTLLSFQDALSSEEIAVFVREADERLKSKPYDQTFQWAKTLIEQYPNCLMLIWQLAVILDVRRMTDTITDTEKYDSYILSWYQRVLSSENEALRTHAADSLFGYYLRKEQYDQAETYLNYYSEQNPERKRKQALLFSRTQRIPEAYKTYEELLFSGYQMINMVLDSIRTLAMQERNMQKAHKLAYKQQELARLFEMGKYHEVAYTLDLATAEKDIDSILTAMETMLNGIREISGFCDSDLYEHMKFQNPDPVFIRDMRQNLLKCFRDEATYGFLSGNERWEKLTQQ